MKKRLYNSVAGLFLLAACGNPSGKVLDTATSGSITIAVDESFRPVIESELEVFSVIYPKTDIHVNYVPEAEAFVQLQNDSVRLVVAARDLDTTEFAHIKNQKITPHSIKIATDAVALIVNKNNPDSTVSVPQLIKILKGEISTWDQLDPKAPKTPINLVFDNKNSSTVRYLREKAELKELKSANFYALDSNEAVIAYVKEHKYTIGVIGVNWVSDRDDSLSNSFLKNVSIMALSATEGAEAFQPYQAYLADGSYPLTRNLYMVSREARTGLGSGFIAFVASDKGQRIIQKTGLMPATVPVRFVELKSENINY